MSHSRSLTEIPVPGKQLCGLTWKNELLWFSDGELDEIMGVNPQTGEIVRHIECPEVRTGLTTVDGNLLQVVGANRTLRQIDIATGQITREFPNPRAGLELCGIETTAAGIWFGYQDPPMLDLRDPHRFELIDSIPVAEQVAGVTVTDKYVAFSCYATAHVHLIDSRMRKEAVATLEVSGNPTGLTWDGRLLWYCDYTNLLLRAVEVPIDSALKLRS